MPALVTSLLRALVACLALLLLAGADAAQADVALPTPDCTASPLVLCKKIRIYNNSDKTGTPTPLYVVIQRGNENQDNWLVALAQTVDPTLVPTGHLYPTSFVYRFYINCCNADPKKDGILPGESVEISVPYYTQLKSGDSSTDTDHYVDWWNGNRIAFFDDQTQWKNAHDADSTVPNVPASSTYPCFAKPIGAACTQVTDLRRNTIVLGDNDRSQLMEYTFAAAVTGQQPFHLYIPQVGYNISSVDQAYLPLTMQPLNNPIPYIGTTVDVGTFRTSLQKFLTTFKGWPIYNTSTFSAPRVPSPATIFAGATGVDSMGKPILNPNLIIPTDNSNNKLDGDVLSNMLTLFKTCRDGTNASAICIQKYSTTGYSYKDTIAFFKLNFDNFIANYLTPNGPCVPPGDSKNYPWVKTPDTTMMARIYGWVPFNDGCTAANANDLFFVTEKSLQPDLDKARTDFGNRQVAYIHGLEYSPNSPSNRTSNFNPFVTLIHDPAYLNMAAYAFSIDDAIGFQAHPGDGLVLTFTGCAPAPNPCVALDKSNRVVVTLGNVHPQIPEWKSFDICTNTFNFHQDIDPFAPSAKFYPQTYPCTVIVTDLKGKQYRLDIIHGPTGDTAPFPHPPPNPPGNLAVDCSQVTPAQKFWCTQASMNIKNLSDPPVAIDLYNNGINANPVQPDNNTHDFNNDGFSDILFRNMSSGQLRVWLQQNGGVINPGTPVPGTDIGPPVSVDWAVVGQRDFNHDGFNDILWRNATSRQVLIYFTNGSNPPSVSGGWSPSSSKRDYTDPSWDIVGTGDFNNDGFGDILWFNSVTGSVRIWLLNGQTQTVDDGTPGAVDPLQWQIAGVGDFNGDGKSDILFRCTLTASQCTPGQLVVWLIDGSILMNGNMPVLGGGSPGTIPSLDWQIPATGDFDADGKSDILFRCKPAASACTPGSLMIWLMYCSTGTLGNCTMLPGSGPVRQADNSPFPNWPGTEWSIVQTGVFNNDGNLSEHHSGILWYNTNDGQLLVWKTVGDIISVRVLGNLSYSSNMPAPYQVQGMNSN